jgi:hypothetical protein
MFPIEVQAKINVGSGNTKKEKPPDKGGETWGLGPRSSIGETRRVEDLREKKLIIINVSARSRAAKIYSLYASLFSL